MLSLRLILPHLRQLFLHPTPCELWGFPTELMRVALILRIVWVLDTVTCPLWGRLIPWPRVVWSHACADWHWVDAWGEPSAVSRLLHLCHSLHQVLCRKILASLLSLNSPEMQIYIHHLHLYYSSLNCASRLCKSRKLRKLLRLVSCLQEITALHGWCPVNCVFISFSVLLLLQLRQ